MNANAPRIFSDTTKKYGTSEDSEIDASSRAIVRDKDEGYAWVILGAMFFSNVLWDGFLRSFGLLINSLTEILPQTSQAVSGILPGVLFGCRSIVAVGVCALLRIISPRNCCLLGGLFCFVGIFSSIFCTSFIQIVITLGAITGAAICLLDVSQVVVLSTYFQKKISIANGIRASGSPFGGMIMPPLTAFLLNTYGLRLSLLLISAIQLHHVIYGMLLRPQRIHEKICLINYMKKREHSVGKYLTPDEKGRFFSQLTALNDQSKSKTNQRSLNFRALRDPVSLLFIVVEASISIVIPHFYFFLPVYGKHIGLTRYENSIILATQSLTDFLLRITIGWIANKKLFLKLNGLITGLIIGGTGTALTGLFSNFWGLLSTTTLFSFGVASYYAYIVVILTEQFGKETVVTIYGAIRTVQGVVDIFAPYFLGLLFDITGGFTAVFSVMGSGMFLAGVILLFEPLLIEFTKSAIVIT